MKIIGAGFGRTGTLSLKVALEKLGYGPCYHMTELSGRPEHVAFWEALPERLDLGEKVGSDVGDVPGARVDFEKVFSDYQATVDFPGCVFWRELTEAYPEARIILSVRDPEKWYESASQTIFAAPGRLLSLTRRWLPGSRRIPAMAHKIIEQQTFGGLIWDREHAISVYKRHNEEVERSVPEEKLLVYEVKEGWEPLCQFLGKEIPDEPFPRVNDRVEFIGLMRRQALRAGAYAPARKLLLVSAAVAGGALIGGAVVLMLSGGSRREPSHRTLRDILG